MISFAKEMQSTTRTKSFRLRGFTLKNPKSYFTGLRGGFLCSFVFYRTAIILFHKLFRLNTK